MIKILNKLIFIFFISFVIDSFSQDYTEDSLSVIGILDSNPEVYPFDVEGISTAENGRIVHLDLWGPPRVEDDNNFENQYKLFKIIPDCVGKLTALKQVACLSQNIWTISPEIAKLDSLTHVIITYNQGLELYYLKEIFDIPNLKYLDVSHSHQTGWGIPEEIQKLTLLENLDISYCDLSELPPEIGKLISLKRINCSHNNHVKIPEEFFTLTSLTYFNFRYSGYANYPLSPGIGNLINLDTLILARCCLYTLPDSIVNIQKLTCLDLGYNYLNPDSMSSEVRAWADKFDPDWLSTQIGVGINSQIPYFKLKKLKLIRCGNLVNVSFELSVSDFVRIEVYNLGGKKLNTLNVGYKERGIHSVNLNLSVLSSGVYYFKFISGNKSIIEKAVFIN